MTQEFIRPLTVNGVRYAYRVQPRTGGGERASTEPAVILGGALQGMFGWPQMDRHLAPHTDVVTADLPGLGDADPLPPGPATGLLPAALRRLLDDLEVPRVNLLGYSFGAILAFDCARRSPERVARLVLGGAPVRVTAGGRACWRRAVRRLDVGDHDGFATLATRALMCSDPSRTVHRRELARRYVHRSLRRLPHHAPHLLDTLQHAMAFRPDFSGPPDEVPTLVFAGEHDSVTLPEHQRALSETIPDSRFVTIADSDHWVVLERAEAVAELAARFFLDQPIEAAAGG